MEKIMNINENYKKNQKESGQSMLELAISIIVLLILLAGVVDLGRVAYYYIAMRDTAQEAASYASIFPYRSDEILKRAVAGMEELLTPTEIIYRINHTVDVDGNDVFEYECKWQITNPDTLPGCGIEQSVNDYSVGDVVEITITNSGFPITMPLLGTFIGSQSINLNTTIQDVVVRVPEPTPTP